MIATKQIESPCDMPNGLQWTDEGLFVMDQKSDNVYVVDETGKLLRTINTPTANGSGITVGGGFLWTASNGNSTSRPARSTDTGLGYIYKLDLKTGEPIDRFRTPDGGGIHGIEWDDGKIWITAFNPLAIHLADPSDNYKIVHKFEVELPRLHGLARVADGLWCAHTTDNVVVKYDIETGAEKERVTLDPGDAFVHGLSIKDGELWYADANFAGKHNTATVGRPEIGILKV
jgi:outer membrane protein assembly factor BamB